MLACTSSPKRGSSGLRRSRAPPSHVVVTPSTCTPSLSSALSAVGSRPNTPIEPVTVPASAITSSAEVEIQ